MILVDRQGEDFPSTNGNLTMEELDFLLRHEEEIPATMEKLDKEKLALLKEIGGKKNCQRTGKPGKGRNQETQEK